MPVEVEMVVVMVGVEAPGLGMLVGVAPVVGLEAMGVLVA